MKRFLIALTLLLLLLPVMAKASDDFKVIAGTSLVEDIVNDLTDGRATILTLIPGASCPGHGDTKASDVVFAAHAELAVLPAFQKNLPPVVNLFKAANNDRLHMEIVDLVGNWMMPPIQREAIMQISRALIKARPDWVADIEAKKQNRLRRLEEAERTVQTQLQPLHGMPVIAAKMQADFLAWTGLSVQATYGGLEEMTPNTMAALINDNRKKNIVAVIDNLQSGASVGRPLAEELGVSHLVLSNFPGSSSVAIDYFSLLNENVEQLLRLRGSQR